jgi:type IV pilus assembly protein PilA
MSTRRLSQAFSLLELLVTITIISVLGAVAVPAYQKYTTKAKIIEAFEILDKYRTEATLLYNKLGILPDAEAVLYPEGNITGKIDKNNKSIDASYVSSVYAETATGYILLGAGFKAGGAITDGNNFFYYAGSINASTNELVWKCGISANKNNNIEITLLPSTCKDTLP